MLKTSAKAVAACMLQVHRDLAGRRDFFNMGIPLLAGFKGTHKKQIKTTKHSEVLRGPICGLPPFWGKSQFYGARLCIQQQYERFWAGIPGHCACMRGPALPVVSLTQLRRWC